MWYKEISRRKRDYVWIANRDSPFYNSNGTLKISDINLVLLDQYGKHVWTSNVDIPSPRPLRSQLVAELLANGNFVLQYSENQNRNVVLWQSFDFPTDTLLPEMKLGWDERSGLNRKLTSWKSQDDPSSGNFTYKMDTGGQPQRFLWRGKLVIHRSDSWNRVGSSGEQSSEQSKHIHYDFTMTSKEVTYSFRVTDQKNFHTKLKLTYAGTLQRLTWPPTATEWTELWIAPTDQCDYFGKCGSYSYCDMNLPLRCKCIQGFKPRNQQAWEFGDMKSGCERKTLLSCDGDAFLKLIKIKLPDTKEAIVDRSIGLKECRKRCLKDCNCTAYANTDPQNRGSGCLIWRTELIDIRIFSIDGQHLFVKLEKSDIGGEGKLSRQIIGFIAGIIVLLFLTIFIFWFWKTKQKRATERNPYLLMNRVSSARDLSGENEDLALPRWDFEIISNATDNFSNKLGEGGYGIVYKGRLLDGKEIAVKRLSKVSVEGTNQFLNEARLIAKLQHVNLVRLLGYCVKMEEHILIYEYMENLSLDYYLFDNTRSCKLNWQRRFAITSGIARGLQYLHEDSHFRVIHRDLKASNILLDKDMTAKISDFGMARIIGRDKTEANTRTLVGTLGYMSPEYTRDGIFSLKSDVFSYGVLLLEILSGKRNWKFKNSNGDTSLLSCVWRNWEEGTWLNTVDPCIGDLSSESTMQTQEVLRCLQIGLLCVQNHAEDRPTMGSVVMMLGSQAEIPQPTMPGFCLHYVGKTSFHNASASSTNKPPDESVSANDVTVSVIEPR